MLGGRKSSESFWTPFDSTTTANTRFIKTKVLVSWLRQQDVTGYAIVGTSIVGGLEVVAGTPSDVDVNNADSFIYEDETDNVIRIEYERHLIEPLGGMSIAIADIVFDNNSLRFTPNYNNTIGTAIRPNRPVKIFVGFQVNGVDRLIPIIEGLSLQPDEDKNSRTVAMSVQDYLTKLNNQQLETQIFVNQYSNQIINRILQDSGVQSSAYELDQGLNQIGFAWFEKGDTAGDRIRKISEAEEAIFYQDEEGKFRYENRNKYSQAPYNSSIWTIEPDDIVEWKYGGSSKIINRVLISGKPRSVKSSAEIWRNGREEQVLAGQTVEVWASFEDPVTDLENITAAIDYTAFTATGGTGSDITGSIDITVTPFAKAAKLEITNNNGATAFLNFLRLRGLPATVDYEIQEVFQDTTSIGDYNVQQVEINNDFIDDPDFAAEMAQNIVRRYKNPNKLLKVTIVGIPHLQLRDQVSVRDIDLGTTKRYRVIGIQGVIDKGGFIQTLTLREITSAEAL